MEAHHAEEPECLQRVEDAFDAALSVSPANEQTMLGGLAGFIREAASSLRQRRGELVAELAPIRSALADLTLEAKDMLPENALSVANVEAHQTSESPWPLSGLTPTPQQWYQILVQNVEWTQAISYGAAAEALGPAYLLSKVIEHPSEVAMSLRSSAEAAVERLRKFMGTAWTTSASRLASILGRGRRGGVGAGGARFCPCFGGWRASPCVTSMELSELSPRGWRVVCDCALAVMAGGEPKTH